jgi:60 kDa SS-A/Ro ribonucleoprotein
VCPDISGSMHSPVTGRRGGGTSKVSCVDVASLVAAAYLRKSTECKIIPFADRVENSERFDARDTVMTTAKKILSLPSGGTNISAPINHIASKGWPADLVIIVSDNESWCDAGWYGSNKTALMRAWDHIKKNNKRAKLVCIDIQPTNSTQAHDRSDVLNVGGFSDTVFQIISTFYEHGLDAGSWKGIIEAQEV